MLKLQRIINRTLSVRLSLMVVMAMALLLMASMAVMLHYSRKTVREEAVQKAQQTLEGTVQRIDNILLSVEQATGNLYFTMLPHLDQPDRMITFCRMLVESNPNILGCAIAFQPGVFQDRPHFMAYVHHAVDSQGSVDKDKLVEETDYNGEYLKQPWYANTLEMKRPGWKPQMAGDNAEEIAIVTFCLPLADASGAPIGVLGVGMSLSNLSSIVGEAKPSDNSYCTLLDGDGSIIVHPSSSKLLSYAGINKSDPSTKEVVDAMTSGQTGYMPFRMNGTDYYIFYKPFERTAVTGRSMEELKWSAGIIYPEDDIFGEYNSLLYYVVAIALVGLLVLFLLSQRFIHRQLTPLIMLAEKAQLIAKGNFNEPIPDSRQQDEIGRLQANFQEMQRTLANNIGELELLTAQLQENTRGLRVAYDQAQKADRMKTAFLHNMSNQMIGPAMAIDKDVEVLVGNSSDTPQNIDELAEDIRVNGTTITDVLKNLIHLSDEDMRKEAAHD